MDAVNALMAGIQEQLGPRLRGDERILLLETLLASFARAGGSLKRAATLPPAAPPPDCREFLDDHFAPRYRPRPLRSAAAHAALRRGDRRREIWRPCHGRGGDGEELRPRHRADGDRKSVVEGKGVTEGRHGMSKENV